MYSLTNALAGNQHKRLLSREEEYAAAVAWRDHQDEKARLLLIQTHVKLVAREVRRMRHYRADPEDLLSEGLMGLSVAIDKFDPDAGFRFSTYAIHWVRAKMTNHVMLTEGEMRVSSSGPMKKLFFSYRRTAAAITERLRQSGETLTRTQIQEITAEKLGVSIEDLQLAEILMAQATALDAPIVNAQDGSQTTLVDTLEDEGPNAEESLGQRQIQERLERDVEAAMAQLKPREQHIVRARKLAPKDEILTLEDLAQTYDLSRERVRQIEVAAMKKLERFLAPTVEFLDAA